MYSVSLQTRVALCETVIMCAHVPVYRLVYNFFVMFYCMFLSSDDYFFL